MSTPTSTAMKPSTVPSDPVAAATSALAEKKTDWTGIDWRPRLSLSPRERIQEWMEYSRNLYHDPKQPKYAFSFEVDCGLHILSLTEAKSPVPARRPLITKAVFGLTVPFAMVTARGLLNGGYAAVVVDRLSALLLCGACQEGFWDLAAASTGLTLFWHSPVLLGEEVEVEVELDNINGSSCIMTAKIRKKKDQVVCITAQHQMRALKSIHGTSKPRL